MATINISIRTNNYFIITKFCFIIYNFSSFCIYIKSKCFNHIADFCVSEYLIKTSFPAIDNLTSNRKHCLELIVSCFLDTTGRRITLRYEQFTLFSFFTPGICKFAWHLENCFLFSFTSYAISCFLRCLSCFTSRKSFICNIFNFFFISSKPVL